MSSREWNIEFPGNPFDENVRNVPSALWTQKELKKRLLEFDESLLKFGQYIRPHALKVASPEFHYEVIANLEELSKPNPDFRKYVISAPRGYAKSFWVNTWILWCLLHKKKSFLVYIGDAAEKVTEEIETIREDLMSNPRVLHLYGSMFERKKDDKKKRVVEKSGKLVLNNRGVLIFESLSSETGKYPNRLRGMRIGNKRPEVIIWDDAESPFINKDPSNKSKFIDWRHRQVVSGMDPINGCEIVANTYMGPFCWTKDLVESKEWKSTYRTCWINEEQQIPLWPELYSKEYILSLREEAIRNGNYEAYLLEQENKTTDNVSPTFNVKALRYIDITDLFPVNRKHVISGDVFNFDRKFEFNMNNLAIDLICVVDPASSEAIDSDYFAATIIGLDERGRYFIKPIVRERGSSWDKTVRKVIDICEDIGVHTIYVEEVAMQKPIINAIRSAGTICRVVGRPSKIKNKFARIEQLKSYLGEGKIIVPQNAPYTTLKNIASDGTLIEAEQYIDLIRILEEDMRTYMPGKKTHRLDILDTIGMGLEILVPPKSYTPRETKGEFPPPFVYKYVESIQHKNNTGFGAIN